MRKRLKWKLVAFFAVIAALFLLGGCQFQESLDEKKDKYNVHASVTYNANGGVFDGTSYVERTLYLPAGSVAMNIGTDRVENGSVPDAVRANYTLIGWYEAQLDENGEAQKTESGEVILKDTPYNFSKDNVLKNGDKVFLYAKWQKNQSVYVYLLCEDITEATEFTLSDESKVSVVHEGLLTDYGYDKTGICDEPTESMYPKANGYTMLEFYTDKACTEKVVWPLDQATYGDYNIYAKYLTGTWTILRDADDVKKQLLGLQLTPKNFYLANDIDCSELTGAKALAKFASTLQGNGYTISNLEVDGTDFVSNSFDATVSIFGKLTADAVIKDVAFKNWTIGCTLKSGYWMHGYILFSGIENTASINGLILKGDIKMDIKRPASAGFYNMLDAEDETKWQYARVLFGGAESDQTQMANGLDVNISNANVKVVMDREQIER